MINVRPVAITRVIYACRVAKGIDARRVMDETSTRTVTDEINARRVANEINARRQDVLGDVPAEVATTAEGVVTQSATSQTSTVNATQVGSGQEQEASTAGKYESHSKSGVEEKRVIRSSRH